jgi:calmodulin
VLAGSGTIDTKELKTALSALGQNPSDEEIFVMISQVWGYQWPASSGAPKRCLNLLHLMESFNSQRCLNCALPLQVDEDGSKEIEFQEFVHAIQINKAMSERGSSDQETLDAFVALGGNVRAVLSSLTGAGLGHPFPAKAQVIH